MVLEVNRVRMKSRLVCDSIPARGAGALIIIALIPSVFLAEEGEHRQP